MKALEPVADHIKSAESTALSIGFYQYMYFVASVTQNQNGETFLIISTFESFSESHKLFKKIPLHCDFCMKPVSIAYNITSKYMIIWSESIIVTALFDYIFDPNAMQLSPENSSYLEEQEPISDLKCFGNHLAVLFKKGSLQFYSLDKMENESFKSAYSIYLCMTSLANGKLIAYSGKCSQFNMFNDRLEFIQIIVAQDSYQFANYKIISPIYKDRYYGVVGVVGDIVDIMWIIPHENKAYIANLKRYIIKEAIPVLPIYGSTCFIKSLSTVYNITMRTSAIIDPLNDLKDFNITSYPLDNAKQVIAIDNICITYKNEFRSIVYGIEKTNIEKSKHTSHLKPSEFTNIQEELNDILDNKEVLNNQEHLSELMAKFNNGTEKQFIE